MSEESQNTRLYHLLRCAGKFSLNIINQKYLFVADIWSLSLHRGTDYLLGSFGLRSLVIEG